MMMAKTDQKKLTIKLPEALAHRLAIAAAVNRTTQQQIVAEALVRYLPTVEKGEHHAG